jgi:hypothetical protein
VRDADLGRDCGQSRDTSCVRLEEEIGKNCNTENKISLRTSEAARLLVVKSKL